MKVQNTEAEAFFEHPTQQKYGFEGGLPGEPFVYFVEGDVCGAFHPSFWPDVWMAHVGVKPEAWGKSVKPALEILEQFAAEYRPTRITAWIEEDNRAALQFAQRLGFVEDGRLPVGVIMLGRRA